MKREEMEKHIDRRFERVGKIYDIIGIMEDMDGELTFAVSPVLETTVLASDPEFTVLAANQYDAKFPEDPLNDVLVMCVGSVVVNVKNIEDAPIEFIELLRQSLDDADMGIKFDCYYVNRSDRRARVVVAGEVVGILPGRVVVP